MSASTVLHSVRPTTFSSMLMNTSAQRWIPTVTSGTLTNLPKLGLAHLWRQEKRGRSGVRGSKTAHIAIHHSYFSLHLIYNCVQHAMPNMVTASGALSIDFIDVQQAKLVACSLSAAAASWQHWGPSTHPEAQQPLLHIKHHQMVVTPKWTQQHCVRWQWMFVGGKWMNADELDDQDGQ